MSFKKRNADQQPKLPSGSRLSAYNGQLLISTGVPSLDDILGGGQPVGTIMLIKEDRATTYAQLLLKYFMAQGISSGHHCAIVSRDEDPEEMLKTLMWLSTSDRDNDDDDESDKAKNARLDADHDRMKIAWRYSHLKRFETGVKPKQPSPMPTPTIQKDAKETDTAEEPKPYCSQFDLTKRIPADVLEKASIEAIRWTHELDEKDNHDDYQILLDKIRHMVVEGQFSSIKPVAPGTVRHALRVGIHSLASPSWQYKSPNDLYKFFHALRGLLRFSFGTAVVTVPAYLYDEAPNVMKRIEHMVDAVIEIESFAGDPVHNEAAYTQNYHGFFHVHKLPVLNSLLPPSTKLSVLSAGGSNDLGFKLRRKRFAIETFHLPPEGGVVTRRTEPPPTTTSTEPVAKTNKKEQESNINTGMSKLGLASLANRNGPKKIGCGSTPGKIDPLEF
ncbi:Elongator complex protein 4 [Blakeslea trispora]|nr:Elongator complex protein 4 [Blakeslea trispora]